ncbi:hypothetical protein D8B26_004917 [Coccidioides posadasii str. Silveira]|uniref:Predicted protein n=1 Tax=Coccidioides posadasii (strain RMSCC 757 / Silveira) TaxID=443226 RepID=E9D769_COCPS|nr:predicted protein [Coccidioides posadasii str. Silveira]QVM10257.1 hypothetical protein D8B26_004917 [Coccidioides posadasii str. Silveira]
MDDDSVKEQPGIEFDRGQTFSRRTGFPYVLQVAVLGEIVKQSMLKNNRTCLGFDVVMSHNCHLQVRFFVHGTHICPRSNGIPEVYHNQYASYLVNTFKPLVGFSMVTDDHPSHPQPMFLERTAGDERASSWCHLDGITRRRDPRALKDN